jgi:D-aspartate ligase
MDRDSLPEFAAIIVGGDLGAYSLARAFNELYGIRPYVVSRHDTWVVKYSKILQHIPCHTLADPDTLLMTINSWPLQSVINNNRRVLLMGSSDIAVQTIITIRDRLPNGVIVPYVGQEEFDRATLKHSFFELCQELDISHPATQILDLSASDSENITLPFGFPIIAKPTDGKAWRLIDFPGKQKVHTIESPAQLTSLVEAVRRTGYTHKLILQDQVPGNDQGMRTLTCYCDKTSAVRFASWGVTLLEQHTGAAIGNPVAMVTSHAAEIVDEAKRMLKALGWVGYANFDLKLDPRDGSMKFLELNARLGRANFYLMCGGNNPATYYVDDYVRDVLDDHPPLVQDQRESCFLAVPRQLLLHYVTDPAMKSWVRDILRRGDGCNPLWNRAETDPRRWALVAFEQLNHVRKFLTHYR